MGSQFGGLFKLLLGINPPKLAGRARDNSKFRKGHPSRAVGEMRDPFFPTDVTPTSSLPPPSNARPWLLPRDQRRPCSPRLQHHPPPSCHLRSRRCPHRLATPSHHQPLPVPPHPILLYADSEESSSSPNPKLNCGMPPSPSLLIRRPPPPPRTAPPSLPSSAPLCKDRWTKRGGVNWAFFKN
jgi:hypothetical protein